MRRLFVGLAIAVATLTPTWARADETADQQIAQKIIQKLQQQKQTGQLKGFGIDLQVSNGTVFMNGRVSSPEHQQLALGIAQRTEGVKEVVNGIKVNGAGAAMNAPEPSAVATGAPAAKSAQSSGMLAGLGGSVKKAFGGASQSEVQQATNTEPVTQTSVLKKPSAVKPVPSYTSETGSGVKQSQMVAAAPSYDAPAPQPRMAGPTPAARPLQSEYHAANPVMRATMPGHTGPARPQTPYPIARTAGYAGPLHGGGGVAAPVPYGGAPVPAAMPSGVGVAPARYDHPYMPGYAWPSYAAYPNYAAVTYPKQYSPTAWPYIGPFYPYPQVPLGWRKVCLEWDDGWWMLDFKDQSRPWKPYR